MNSIRRIDQLHAALALAAAILGGVVLFANLRGGRIDGGVAAIGCVLLLAAGILAPWRLLSRSTA